MYSCDDFKDEYEYDYFIKFKFKDEYEYEYFVF